MADIVWMTFPIRFHLREKIGSVDALRLGDGILNQVRLLTVHLVVVRLEKVIEPCWNAFERLFLSDISLSQRGNCFSLKVRQRRIHSSRRKRLSTASGGR